MSKIVYYVAASQDGYIATPDHRLDWLDSFSLGDDATPYDTFYQSIGAIIMGGETYRWIMANSPHNWPYLELPSFVLSRHPVAVPEGLDITQVTACPHVLAEQAKLAAKGRDVWLIGGGKTAAWLADAGELQRLFITTLPLFLGQGVEVLPVKQPVKVIHQSVRLLSSGAGEYVMDILPPESGS